MSSLLSRMQGFKMKSPKLSAVGPAVQQGLMVPVYLNQRIVFDVLAMLEGGIARVTRVAASERRQEADERRYGLEFGLSKALASLLTINVSGNRTRVGESGCSVTKDEERVHTPASLFYRLRNQLEDLGLLHHVEEGYVPRVHDLIQFDASMTRNPLIQTMDSLISLYEIAVVFSDEGDTARSQHRQARQDSERTLKQMKAFVDKLRAGDTLDMVADRIAGECRAVVTLEMEYLNDPTMADLVDGHFTVVGKVIRSVAAGEGAISLIRKSALTIMPKTLWDAMKRGLEQLAHDEGFNLPDLSWELPAPAFQVIPLAVFA